MTDFYKIVDDGYIVGFGTNGNDSVTEITEEEYNDLVDFFKTRPAAPEGFVYKLRADTLEWELVELPPEPEPEPTVEDKAEAYDILTGVSE